MSTHVYYYNTLGQYKELKPAPLISVSPEFYYANDNIIGYTYNVTLNGYAAGLESDYSPDPSGQGFDALINSIDKIKQAFNHNGGSVEVWNRDNQNNFSKLLSAKGALIKSIEFNSSDNYWVNYAPYTIELEFNEVDFIGCSGTPEIVCHSGIFNDYSTASNLVDINQFKIKEFNDNWSFTVQDIHQDYDDSFFNNIIELEYTISAVGKNYYGPSNQGTILPAWEQAKNFVQDRLHNQLKDSLNNILVASSHESCNPVDQLNQLFSNTNAGVLKDISFLDTNNAIKSTGGYKIYDEMISCQTSESKGSFSATYTSKLKRHNPNITSDENSVLHKYSKNITVNNDQKYNHSISIEGTIQGLLPGSLVDRMQYDQRSKFYDLPKNGKFFTARFLPTHDTKYDKALRFFKGQIGSEDDLNDYMKGKLGVTYLELGLKEMPESDINNEVVSTNGPPYPVCSNFTMGHDYSNGTISYSAQYDSDLAVGLKRGYTNVSITRNDPVPVIQEFIIPGRAAGPIIQNLNMFTQKSIAININGADPRNKTCIDDLSNDVNICSLLSNGPYANIENIVSIINNDNADWVRTKKDYTLNPIDGSFSINLEYTCVGHLN